MVSRFPISKNEGVRRLSILIGGLAGAAGFFYGVGAFQNLWGGCIAAGVVGLAGWGIVQIVACALSLNQDLAHYLKALQPTARLRGG